MSRPVITAAPAASLTMEEIKFWLDIMQEHALFIKLGLPAENAGLIGEAECFYKDFSGLINRAAKVSGEKQFVRLVSDSLDVIAEFLRFKRHLLHQMLVCKVGGNNPPLMLDHMAREAEYVLAIFGKIKNGAKNPHLSKTRENVFWLRLMADHTKFILGRTDPTERAIMHTVQDFSNEFDDLFLEANDFYSMLTHPGQLPLPAVDKKVKKSYYGVLPHLDPPAYDRFVHDVRSSVLRLRDFKRALYKMTVDCRVVSIIPPLLADHVRREADHFLMVLAMMEKDMIGVAGDYADPMEAMAGVDCPVGYTNSFANQPLDMDENIQENTSHLDCDDEDDDDEIAVASESQYVQGNQEDDEEYDDDCDDGCEDEHDWDDEEDDSDEEEDYEDDDDEREKFLSKHQHSSPKFMVKKDAREPVTTEPPKAAMKKVVLPAQPVQSTQAQPSPTAPNLESQVKWSGKWPRPLGRVKD